MITANEINGLYAILPTPAKPGANKLDAVNTVDLDETERVVSKLLDEGVSGLIVLGTTGECATLSRPDFEAFTRCVTETVKRRVPTFVGTTALGGHEVASRMKFIRECGADGTLLGLPMWQPLTTKTAVEFYRAMSESFPDIAVMVYANIRAFRYDFPFEFWEALLREAPTVVAAKLSRPKKLLELVQATKGRINIMPNEMTVDHFFATSPETTTACWATAAAMAPAPLVSLMKSIAANDTEQVKSMAEAIAWANEPLSPVFKDPEIFALYNIQVEKTRITAAGYCNAGPIRPPYDDLPEQYQTASRECGQRWATLQQKYSAKK